jgi:hypothetical protein
MEELKITHRHWLSVLYSREGAGGGGTLFPLWNEIDGCHTVVISNITGESNFPVNSYLIYFSN